MIEFRPMGYYGRKIEELEKMSTDGWLIADIRINPFSRFQPDFIGKRMAARLNSGYLHIPEWGNPRRKESILAIQDFAAGLKKILKMGKTHVILLCACKYPLKCHRSLLGQKLQEAGYKVEEVQGR